LSELHVNTQGDTKKTVIDTTTSEKMPNIRQNSLADKLS